MSQQYLDKTGALYIITKIKTLLSNKIDKDGDKMLTDVNFSAELKNKLDTIQEGAEVNNVSDSEKSNWNAKQDALMFNTAYNASTNKAATMADINSAISGVVGISFLVVSELPTTGKNGVIYLVSNSGNAQNSYDEYIWISSSNTFEKIGTSDVDLSNYLKISDLTEISTNEIDAMFS